MAQKAITAPETFDIFGGYNYQDIQVWSSQHLLPIDTHKITAWPQLYKLFAWGKVQPGLEARPTATATRRSGRSSSKQGHDRAAADEGRAEDQQGHRPVDRRDDGQADGGKPMPRYIVGPPAHFNADSIGYNADVITEAAEPGRLGRSS